MIKGECWASVEVCTRLGAFRVYSFILKHALMHQFICWEVCVYEYLSCCCLNDCIFKSSSIWLLYFSVITTTVTLYIIFNSFCLIWLLVLICFAVSGPVFCATLCSVGQKRPPELLVNNLSCCLGWGFQCSCFAEGRLKSAWKPHSHVSRRPGNVCLPLHPSSPDSTRHVYVIYMTRMSLFHHFMCYQRPDN